MIRGEVCDQGEVRCVIRGSRGGEGGQGIHVGVRSV